MTCTDCGTKDYEITRKPVGRWDVCDACWETRGAFVAAMSTGCVSQEQLNYVQDAGLSRSTKMQQVLDTQP